MAPEPSSKIEGYVEELSALKLAGWVWDIGSNRDITVEVLQDGRPIGQAVASRFRKDLLDGGKGNGKHAFEFAYPAPMAEFARPGAVQVRVVGSESDLPLIDPLKRRLKQAAPAPRSAAALPQPAPASSGRIHGLAFENGVLSGRAELPAGRAALRIAIDDVVVGETNLAQAFDAQGPASGPHPFTLAVPAALQDGAAHRIAVVDAASGRRLEGGPDSLLLAMSAPVLPAAATLMPVVVTVHGDDGRAAYLQRLCGGDNAPLLAGLDDPAAGQTPAREVSAARLSDLVRRAAALARELPCTSVIVSPPGLAALVLGNAIRRLHDCPLLVDIRDVQPPLAPLDAAQLEDLVRRNDAGALRLDDPAWLPLIQALIAEADGAVSANATLRRQAGGMVVRHGCDEAVFDPARHNRTALRAAAGLGMDDRVVLVATPDAAQTSLPGIIAALERLADPRLVLCIIADTLNEAADGESTAVRVLRRVAPDAIGRAEALAIVDCLIVPNLAADAMPQAVLEALAMDVPIVARSDEALADLVACGAIHLAADGPALDAALLHLARDPVAMARQSSGRMVYAGEFGHAVNALRMTLALHGAQRRPAASQPQWQALLRALRRASGTALPAPAPADGSVGPELIMCTSSNDTDLGGGRADRFATTLLAMGKPRRIVQFDQPISAAKLEALAAGGQGDAHRGSLIYASTVRRVLGLADTPDFIRRTFLHRSGKKAERLMGRDLPPAATYPAFLAQVLTEAGVQPGGVLWVSAGADYAALRQAAGAAVMVVDLDPACFVQADAEQWNTAVRDADVVICGSTELRDRFAGLRSDIVLVPDGDDAASQAWQAVRLAL